MYTHTVKPNNIKAIPMNHIFTERHKDLKGNRQSVVSDIAK